MSFWHIFTTAEFWTGGLVVGVLGSAATFITTRAGDRRKFSQEDKVLDRTEARQDKLRQEENLYAVATEFVEVCSDIVEHSIDIKGVFNAIRDMFYNRVGMSDPNADAKLDHATKRAEDTKRLVTPFNKLRLVAPVNVLDAAIELNGAILALLSTTTEPFATPITYKTAGEQLDNFINVFRAEIGRQEYTSSMAQQKVISFLGNLKEQTAAYMEEAKAEMRAAGFQSTPWDDNDRA